MRYKNCARGYVFMSNKQQDKQLLEDQAFIDSLYQELADETDNPAEEQPSAQLDQRILAAAHKAVTTEQILKAQSKKSWFYPIATAASAILMITLVGHQIYSPVTENFEMPLALTESAPAVDNEVAEMETSLDAAQFASDTLFVSDEEEINTAMAAAKMQPPAAKEAALQIAKQAKQSKAKRSSMKKEDKIEALKSIPEQQKLSPATKPLPLTTKQYLALKAESQLHTLYWILMLETETSYIIELQNRDNPKTFYLLQKQQFMLDDIKSSVPKPFSDIQKRDPPL